MINGRVQGVGFRFFTMKQASRCNISGSVKNTYKGKVDINACGKKSDLDAFLRAIKKGPAYSEVKDVDVEWKKSDSMLAKGFKITY